MPPGSADTIDYLGNIEDFFIWLLVYVGVYNFVLYRGSNVFSDNTYQTKGVIFKFWHDPQ